MAITTSAKRAIRVSSRKRVVNLRRVRTMKETMKTLRDNAPKGNTKTLAEELRQAYKALDKAAKRGVIKKGTASRKKSRLAKLVAKHSA